MAIPLDQRLARVLVAPLKRSPVTPNQITALSLGLALAAGALFSTGSARAAAWAAGLFALARFLDHADGELARLKGSASRFGYYFDYAVGAVSSAALFVGIGIGFQQGVLGQWSVAAARRLRAGRRNLPGRPHHVARRARLVLHPRRIRSDALLPLDARALPPCRARARGLLALIGRNPAQEWLSIPLPQWGERAGSLQPSPSAGGKGSISSDQS